MKIYDAAEIRQWDQYTIQHEPISSIDLMERAAGLCCKHLLGVYSFNDVHFICGMGNNGGDGLVMARILHRLGKKVNISICSISEKGSADFETNLKRLPADISINYLGEEDTFNTSAEIIVDCLFGSGLNRPVEGWLGNRIDEVNNCKKPIVAIDTPSGLFGGDNSSNPLNHIIKANYTFSFQTPKFSFLFATYERYTGIVRIINIGLLEAFTTDALAEIIKPKLFKAKKRSQFDHKGKKGFLTFVGGFDNMIGAAVLSTIAAFRAGCGYVGVICDDQGKQALFSRVPEALYLGNEFIGVNEKTRAIAIGPSLGTSDKSKATLKKVFSSNLPIVIDADGINLCAQDSSLLKSLPKGTILTPHLKELERLIGKANSPEAFLKKQIAFSVKHQVFVIQKGAWSKLTTPNGKVFINPTGNPGMGTSGMGDALTGVIGSFLAQGFTPIQAAIQGIYYHGKAGDIVKQEQGETGIMTSDVIAALPRAINGF